MTRLSSLSQILVRCLLRTLLPMFCPAFPWLRSASNRTSVALQLYQGERYGTNDHGKASLSRTRFCYVLFHGSQLSMTDLAAFSSPMRSAVHLAIAHELHLYVEEYLQAQRDARTLSDNTQDSRGWLVRGLGSPAVSSHKAPYSDLCKLCSTLLCMHGSNLKPHKDS